MATSIPGSRLDFEAIVNEAARRFESRHNIKVSLDARRVLIDRGEMHRADVQRDLNQGKVTISKLTTFVYRQLEEALNVHTLAPAPLESIDANRVMFGMQEKCHYLPWC
jgi:hypothetical protein